MQQLCWQIESKRYRKRGTAEVRSKKGRIKEKMKKEREKGERIKLEKQMMKKESKK